MKVRIFALAKELGLENKELVALAKDAGLEVKSSPLASVTDEQAAQLREMAKSSSAKPASTAPARDDVTPVREAAPEKKLRDLGRTGGTGPLAGRRRRKADDDAIIDEPVAEEIVPVEEEEVVEEAPVEQPVAVDEPVETPDQAEEITSPDEESEPAEDDVAAEDGPKPMTKEDYVAPTRRSIGVREMKAVGTVRDGSRNARAKKKSEEGKKPNLPNIVLPNFTGPASETKKEEEKAQKPDMTFTADLLNQASPLSGHIRRGDKDAAGGRRGPIAPSGKRHMGLGDVRDKRNKSREQRSGFVRRDDENRINRRNIRSRAKKNRGPIELKTEATVEFPLSHRDLCEAIGRPFKELFPIIKRIKDVPFPTINDMIEEEEALEVCLELGVELNIAEKETAEDRLIQRLEADLPDDAETANRPPIITILGHVDHGKTTLVDRLRGSNVTDGEAGGITQHIAAYQVEHNDQKLTFVDTPGHAAFGEMRARGANVTDIVILVVAADDGVMPQTIESISHAKAAGVPIIVAMNKCDLEGRDEQKVLTDLSQHDMLPSEWGGDYDVVRVSALDGTGIDDLLETILLTAELQEYQAAVDIDAYGVCLEGFRDEGRGPMAWTIVQQGTLSIGDTILCGPAFGRVRAMYNDRDEEITEAGPSTPVRITGLNVVPGPGDRMFEMESIDEAREVAEEREQQGRRDMIARRGGGAKTLEDILAGDGPKNLNLIIKADTPGSIEAILHEVDKFEHDEVAVRVLHEGIGGVNESDVYLAAAAEAIVIAFQVIPDSSAESIAEKEGVEIRRYSIIYEVADDIRDALEGLLDPDKQEVATGRAIVLQTFSISRFGTIAGCRVLNGTIGRNNRVHVIRDNTILNDYPIASLRREKDDVREVREGFECGIRLDGFNDIKEGDLLEAFRIDEVKRTLD